MTGDGVNDILAMKEADCSVAMASGSEAASHAAQLVLAWFWFYGNAEDSGRGKKGYQ